VLRVECTQCDRKARYHVHKLIEKYGRQGNLLEWVSDLALMTSSNFVGCMTGRSDRLPFEFCPRAGAVT
jgi:hypothetical protein